VTDLGLCNDENRCSLTSSAVVEKCQYASSKNTIDEMADAITGGNDIGLRTSGPSGQPIYRKNARILVEI